MPQELSKRDAIILCLVYYTQHKELWIQLLVVSTDFPDAQDFLLHLDRREFKTFSFEVLQVPQDIAVASNSRG